MTDRRRPRLKAYDYRTPGAYFITICAKDRKCLFGSIEPLDEAGEVNQVLSPYGECAEKQILDVERAFPFAHVHCFVIMPNHIHILLSLSEMAARDIPFIIGRMKSIATRECWALGYPEKQLFQTSFHEHIVRNEKEFEEIWQYIVGNPQKWCDDRYYIAP